VSREIGRTASTQKSLSQQSEREKHNNTVDDRTDPVKSKGAPTTEKRDTIVVGNVFEVSRGGKRGEKHTVVRGAIKEERR